MSGSVAGQAQYENFNALLRKIDEKVNALQNKINSLLKHVPGWLSWAVDKIVDLWNKFVEQLKRLWNLLAHIVQNMGAPWKLYDTADAWSDQVGGPVSARAATTKAGSLAIDDNWDGAAADQYRQKMLLHEAPLDKMRATFADGINTALSSAAAGIIKFWVALGVAFAALIGGLISAAGASGTIIGIPAGIVIAIGAVVACAAAVSGGVLLLKSDLQTADSTLRAKISDNTGYPGQHWPTFVTG